MDILSLLLLVAGFQIAAASSPGPNFILISSYSTTKSIRHALLAIVGIVAGIMIWSSLVVLGLGSVISSSPKLYSLIQYFGAGYLIWLGVTMIASSFNAKDKERKEDTLTVASSPIVKGFIVNIGNPKTIAYYTSLFAVLIPVDSDVWVLIAVVVTDAVACSFWWIFVAFLFGASPVKNLFIRMRNYIDRAFGGALILLGLKLAIDRP